MELKDIQDLIKFVSKTGVSEVEIEKKDFKITIKKQDKKKKEDQTVILQQPAVQQAPVQQPVQQAAPAPQAAAQPAAETTKQDGTGDDSKYITIKSPMIGTFYRKPTPDKPSFVEVGDTIKAGDVICIVEAMKLFNEIEAEVSGTVVKVLVDDQNPVEYDQPLFLIDPS